MWNQPMSAVGHLRDARHPATVIVVNGDSALRQSLRFALLVEGFSVQDFACGADLLAAADLPDDACLVTDQQLVDMSGLDLVAQLRSRGLAPPAILISTKPTGRLRRQAGEAGVAVIEQPRGDAIVDQVLSSLARLGDPKEP
jgi:FixJ family two-component response regulator